MFDARLVNAPCGDPALVLRFPLATPSPQGVVYLLDCGSLLNLAHAEMLKVKRVFISHTHIDHAIGLDHLLRVMLYSPSPLHIYGPPGIIEQFTGRLRGYAWNLIGDSPFEISLHEIHSEYIHTRVLRCRDQFRPGRISRKRHKNYLDLEEGCSVRWLNVDHGVPCFGFRFEGRGFYRFLAERARELGLFPGPWVGELKDGAQKGLHDKLSAGGKTIGELAPLLLQWEPPATLAYITDTRIGETQRQRFVPFVKNCQQLWCESTYCQADLDKAETNLHATAEQSALLARDAEVGELHLFHVSRRYQGDASRHLLEAQAIFPNTQLGPTLPWD